MNVIIQIQGREAIPVRAIALVTHWRFMSPDVIVRVLGGIGGKDGSVSGDLESYRVEGGQVLPMNKDWWVQFPLKELRALGKKIKETETIDEVGYSEWQKLSLKELPAGVFIWKDGDGTTRPLQRTAAQDAAIICEIKKQGYDPLGLPANQSGKKGVKHATRREEETCRAATHRAFFQATRHRSSQSYAETCE